MLKILGVGTLSSTFGCWLGAIISYFLVRSSFGSKIREKVALRISKSPVLQALDQLTEREGLKFIILARLSAFLPFSPTNYVIAVSSVSLRDYAHGTIYIWPQNLLMVYMGATASTIQEALSGGQEMTLTDEAIMVGSLVAAVAGVLWTTLYVRRIMR